MEKCNHDSKRLHDIKTIKLYIVSGCSNVMAEKGGGDRLCLPGFLKNPVTASICLYIGFLLTLIICWCCSYQIEFASQKVEHY
jgi:hypothetical protein